MVADPTGQKLRKETFELPQETNDIIRIINAVPAAWRGCYARLFAPIEMHKTRQVISHSCLYLGYYDPGGKLLLREEFCYADAKPYEYQEWPKEPDAAFPTLYVADTYPGIHQYIEKGKKPALINIENYGVGKSKLCVISALKAGYRGVFRFAGKFGKNVIFSHPHEKIEVNYITQPDNLVSEVFDEGLEKILELIRNIGCLDYTLRQDIAEKEKEMWEAASQEEYEKAAVFRDELEALKKRLEGILRIKAERKD